LHYTGGCAKSAGDAAIYRWMNVRAIWISDVHLGTKHAQVRPLLDFLRDHESAYIYIVGDFIDGWMLRRNWHWEDSYNVLIQKLLRKQRKKTRVIYITGNHDEFLEEFRGFGFGSVKLMERTTHTTADGRRILVIHGHQFDGLTHFNRLLDRVGTVAYNRILDLNLILNRIRRRLGFGYWSFASYVKYAAKRAVKHVSDYENALIQYARKNRMDGVICGHIHRAEISQMGPVLYMNCGDWVESCTALMERNDGTIELMQWRDSPQCLKLHRTDPQGDFWGGMAA
jgi:UDP-2,3-diacylglucosamine pyrophosphatase LpxH